MLHFDVTVYNILAADDIGHSNVKVFLEFL